MQKTMRYHIADGDNQPVVRAVPLVAQRAQPEQTATERSQTEQTTSKASSGKTRWLRPALRKAHLRSS